MVQYDFKHLILLSDQNHINKVNVSQEDIVLNYSIWSHRADREKKLLAKTFQWQHRLGLCLKRGNITPQNFK